ncbi:hypothetical protein ACLOJK_040008 [Asimina triloba]
MASHLFHAFDFLAFQASGNSRGKAAILLRAFFQLRSPEDFVPRGRERIDHMAAARQQTQIPLPPQTGGKQPDLNGELSVVPIHIVTDVSQLPSDFLEPSAERQLIIGFDCEGVDLCRYGTMCIMQLAFPDAVYLVDAIQGGKALMQACKPALESSYITKVVHDCKRDSEALYFQFGIKLNNVVDTQVRGPMEKISGRGSSVPCDNPCILTEAHTRGTKDYRRVCEEHAEKNNRVSTWAIVTFTLDGDTFTYKCDAGISYAEKQEVRVLLRQDPGFWTYRPLSDLMVRAAADDVRFLLYIYHKMMERLNERSSWLLALRGALYCRCFCINNNNYVDWPLLPPMPDSIVAEENAPEEEILSVLEVPSGKMGVVIGRRGASIMAVKESCNAEILVGGAKGPPDKVFIIGPVKQVQKAEALLRGRMLEM